MESSYWRYLSVYEKEEWAEKKLANESDEDAITRLIDSNEYNPLEDTRPWYHATYNDVRGSDDIFKPLSEGPANYVLTDKGDEHQMNERNSQSPVSFMDMLNAKTVLKCKSRIYDADTTDGGDVYQQPEEGAVETWNSGKSAGINFDLPTEAQWEYCCRGGSSSAFPPDHDLG